LTYEKEDNDRMDKDVFDVSKALEVVDGDTELFEEITDLFLEDFPENITRIREGVTNGDAGALEQAAHSLKVSVANFSAKRAFDAAYKLEVIGKEGKLEGVGAALSDLEKEKKDLEAILKEALAGDVK
jgi:HPt (histidine-containing phosphotransfer) domain-containing protein